MPLLWFQAAKAGCLIRSPADAVAVAFANGEGFKPVTACYCQIQVGNK
jgi:hypothetical protein